MLKEQKRKEIEDKYNAYTEDLNCLKCPIEGFNRSLDEKKLLPTPIIEAPTIVIAKTNQYRHRKYAKKSNFNQSFNKETNFKDSLDKDNNYQTEVINNIAKPSLKKQFTRKLNTGSRPATV